MKSIVSLLLSLTLWFHWSFAQKGVKSSKDRANNRLFDPLVRLKQEEKIQDFIKTWNQSSSYSQWIDPLALAKKDKIFLQQLIKKEKQDRKKTVIVEYQPARSKLIFHWDEGPRPVWLLSLGPNMVFYDGNNVMEFQVGQTVQDFFSENAMEVGPYLERKKKNSSQSGKTSRWLLFLPSAQAQLIPSTPETVTPVTAPSAPNRTFSSPLDEHNKVMQAKLEKDKKAKKKLKKENQTLLFVFLGALGAAIALPPAYNNASNLLNPHWGSEGNTQLKLDIKKLKEEFPQIDRDIFDGGPVTIKKFSCESFFNRNSPLKKVSYEFYDKYDGKPPVGVDLNLMDTPYMKQDIVNVLTHTDPEILNFVENPPPGPLSEELTKAITEKKRSLNLAKKVKALDRCCQIIPCEKWMEERLSETKDPSSTQMSVDDFIDKKEREARGSK